ncbi:MAG: hypothetical protein WKF36_07495 [Candidatus Nitrosocosmicus sp.]
MKGIIHKISQITTLKQQNQQIGNQWLIIKDIVYPFDPRSYISKRITIIAAATKRSPTLIKKQSKPVKDCSRNTNQK